MPTTDIPVGPKPIPRCEVENCVEEGNFTENRKDANGKEFNAHLCHRHYLLGAPVARKK